MSDKQKALLALAALAETCKAAKLALAADPTSQSSRPPLDVLHKDYLSLITLIYTSTTKASLVLRPSEPAYQASLSPLQDLTKHVSAVTTCTTLFDEHGHTLAKETRRHTADLLSHVQAFAEAMQQQDDPANKDYLVRTGAVHDAVEQIRRELPADNAAAVQRRLTADRGMLADCLEEVQEIVKGGGDEDEDDLDDWDDDGLEELGFGKSKPLSPEEIHRAKQCGKLMQWTCTLHKKILRDLQSKTLTDLPNTSIDLLPKHSHELLLAAEDLVASLYAPQDPMTVKRAVHSIDAQFQAFRRTLFDRDGQEASNDDLHELAEKMSKVAVTDSSTTQVKELPHGYETSFRVLAQCIAKASEETPPQE